MKKSIIIVEDDNVLADMYKQKFENAGYTVKTVASAKSCLDWFKTNQASLALIDIMLPGMNGLQLIKNLRKTPVTKEMKIVILTNLTQSDVNLHQTIRESLQVEGFFEKAKVSPAQLLRQVKALLK